jgi:predicted secreted protein
MPRRLPLRTVLVTAAVAAGVAGCAGTTDTACGNCAATRDFFNLQAPVLRTDAQVNATQVTLRRWQAMTVTLDEDSATGYHWELMPLPETVAVAPVHRDLMVLPGQEPAMTGGPGRAVFRLRGVGVGTTPVVLEYRRAFDPAPPAQSVRFDLVVN